MKHNFFYRQIKFKSPIKKENSLHYFIYIIFTDHFIKLCRVHEIEIPTICKLSIYDSKAPYR